jgi:hypothetical protein
MSRLAASFKSLLLKVKRERALSSAIKFSDLVLSQG